MRKSERFLVCQPKKENALGYCHSGKHQGYVSEKTLKSHGCLGKQCPRLEKYLDNPYWIERERIKAEKKAKKNVL
jgi:hypothetical protein